MGAQLARSGLPWRATVTALALVVLQLHACAPSAEPARDDESRWRRVAETEGGLYPPPPGYAACGAPLALTPSLEAVVCRRIEDPKSAGTPPQQLLLRVTDAVAGRAQAVKPGPTFGDAYSVRLAAFESTEGTDAVILMAESVTEFPQGVDVFGVSAGELRSLGFLDVVGIDADGEATSILPLLQVTGTPEEAEITIAGAAARMQEDGTYAMPRAGERLCFLLREGRLVQGSAVAGKGCQSK